MDSEQKQKTVALTGATGFIGPYIISALINAGYHVRALTRRDQDPRVHVTWVRGQLDDKDVLRDLLAGADHAIHAAGAIKARSKADFFHINEACSRLIAEAALESGVKNLVLLSSLAAREAELSDYAASKAASEDAIKSVLRDQLPWTILRPPAVFGPGDSETLKIFKSIQAGFAPLLDKDAKAAWIYAEDLADACVAALTSKRAYFHTCALDDGSGGYFVRDSHALVAQLLGVKLRLIPIPKLLLKMIGAANEIWAKLTGKTPMLTQGKARELSHADWSLSSPNFADYSDWEPKTPLKEGLKTSLSWYQEKGLL